MTAKNKKKRIQEAGRWVRVGTLTITTLGPVINLLLARLRERMEAAEIADALKQAKHRSVSDTTHTDVQEKAQAVDATLADLLAQSQKSPYSKELLRHGEHLIEELKERWESLSSTSTEREMSQELARRGDKATQDFGKRSLIAQPEQATQKRRIWIVLGFAVGLSSASIATFLLLRRRFWQQTEETSIQLVYNDRVPNTPASTTDGAHIPQTAGISPVALANNTKIISKPAIPMDATLVGIVNTRRYYPIKTPLDQLPTAANKPLDVIYFASEEEARAQGFLAEAEPE